METRQWLGRCDTESIGFRITGERGQFDSIPYEPYEIKCPFDDCELVHLMLPVTAERFAEWEQENGLSEDANT